MYNKHYTVNYTATIYNRTIQNTKYIYSILESLPNIFSPKIALFRKKIYATYRVGSIYFGVNALSQSLRSSTVYFLIERIPREYLIYASG